MNPQNESTLIKIKNVIDMAITFTAMTRLFKKGSKQKIAEKLENSFCNLERVTQKNAFERIHSEFCTWFVKNISTARRVLKNNLVKYGQAASWGQAAKVFDIAAKVYVYYCHLPSCDAVSKLLPLLHGAVDTRILKNLRSLYPDSAVKARTIEAVSRLEYFKIQRLVSKHIEEEFKNKIYPVQYDDIMWYRLNRGAEK